MFQLKIDIAKNPRTLCRSLEQKFGMLPKQVKQAMQMAQEGTLEFMKRRFTELSAEEYYIKPSVIRKSIRIQNYAKGARFSVSGERQPLHRYKLTPTRPGRKAVKLQGAVKRAGGLKPLGSAFLMRTKTGKYIAMRREGRNRLPVKALIGPAIPQIAVQYWDRDIKEAASETFRQLMGSYINKLYMLQSAGGEVSI